MASDRRLNDIASVVEQKGGTIVGVITHLGDMIVICGWMEVNANENMLTIRMARTKVGR